MNNLSAIQKSLKNLRKYLQSSIKRIVKPFLHTSGFVDEKSHDGFLQLCTLKSPKKFKKAFSESLRNGIDGFDKYGFIEDGFGGGLLTVTYSHLSIEDLLLILQFVQSLKKEDFND